jgi:hypothetical protein
MGKVWGEGGRDVWGLMFGVLRTFVVCCLKGSMNSIGLSVCIINGIASKFHNVANAHGSPLTRERGCADRQG